MVRLISGVLMAAGALAAILFLPVLALRVLVCVVAVLAAREYLTITGGHRSALLAVVAACVLSSNGTAVCLALVPFLVLATVVLRLLITREAVARALASGFAPVYVGMPLGLLVVIHAQHGWQATLLLIATVVVSDSAQYYTGRTLGRHPLAPAISPKKTIEGAAGGLVFGSAFMVLAGGRVLPDENPMSLALLGLVLVVLGIAGDLFESQLKREAGMKDSGSIIPGHGGVLDRIDALLFTAPAFYLYLVGL
jgi:phosphatidate cytidylyltransferase